MGLLAEITPIECQIKNTSQNNMEVLKYTINQRMELSDLFLTNVTKNRIENIIWMNT